VLPSRARFTDNSGPVLSWTSIPIHHSHVLIGDDMVAHVQQRFDREMQEALGAAIMLGIRQDLIAVYNAGADEGLRGTHPAYSAVCAEFQTEPLRTLCL
jgi:hypothetical protein